MIYTDLYYGRTLPFETIKRSKLTNLQKKKKKKLERSETMQTATVTVKLVPVFVIQETENLIDLKTQQYKHYPSC